MNKQELLREVAAKADLTIKDAGAFFEAFTEVIAKELKNGEKVTLIGFGTFQAKKRAARTAINPKTKAQVKVPATVVPSLKFGKAFKEKISK